MATGVKTLGAIFVFPFHQHCGKMKPYQNVMDKRKRFMVRIGDKILQKSISLMPRIETPKHSAKAILPKRVTDFEIIVHGMDTGMGQLGHVDVCIDGYVYSYGNYDELTCSMNGAKGEGIVLKAPRNAYFKFCKRHYHKTLYVYSLQVSAVQKANVLRRLEYLLEQTASWVPTDEICSLNPVSGKKEEMYAYFMLQEMPVEFYKFTKTRFESYTVWRHNCLLFVDSLAACLEMPRLRARVTTFPSLYQDRLEHLWRKKRIVVNRMVY